jgi:hypothetical protein
MSRPGDALVYVYIWQAGYIDSHYAGNELALYQAPSTPEATALQMTESASSHGRLWLLSYQIGTGDTHNLPASWLETHGYRVEDRWFGDHNLALYLAPHYETPGVGPRVETATFEGQIELRYPSVDAHLHPGDALALPLQWRPLAEMDNDYKVFVHIGMPGVPPAAQSDGEPKNGLSPTSSWQAGDEIVDRRGILLPGDISPGRHQVLVGLYRPSDGSRLQVDGEEDSDAVLIGHVEVER